MVILSIWRISVSTQDNGNWLHKCAFKLCTLYSLASCQSRSCSIHREHINGEWNTYSVNVMTKHIINLLLKDSFYIEEIKHVAGLWTKHSLQWQLQSFTFNNIDFCFYTALSWSFTGMCGIICPQFLLLEIHPTDSSPARSYSHSCRVDTLGTVCSLLCRCFKQRLNTFFVLNVWVQSIDGHRISKLALWLSTFWFCKLWSHFTPEQAVFFVDLNTFKQLLLWCHIKGVNFQ